jgi:phosphoribosylformylglycinamidine synthase I
MKAAVVVFPGSNRERDVMRALSLAGSETVAVWHADTTLPEGVDLVVLPGGFSYGDYLRSGAIAARAPIMAAVRRHAQRGGLVLGICNGFQILTEAGLLPGALMRNAGLTFVCREVKLTVVRADTPFTAHYQAGQVIRCAVAHHDGNYFAEAATLDRLEGEGQVVFRYGEGTNPNGSARDIAGICSANRRVLGLMPHPENLVEEIAGGTDGRPMFESLAAA